MTECKFEFKVTDKFDKFAYDKAKPLVEFVAKHIDFLPCLCDGLTRFCKYDSVNKNGRNGKNRFTYFLETYDFNNVECSGYLSEFEKKFREAYDIKSKYPKASEDDIQDKLGKVRGVILELLIEDFVKVRYKQTRNNKEIKFSKGCIVVVNDKELVIDDRVTVDIAGWDGSKGEFYETKVGPQNFDEDVLKLLSHIKDELDLLNVQAIVGCVTMANRDKLLDNINEIKPNITGYNDRIEVIGKRELINLIQEPFSIYA
ncbi:hypothetical protein ACV3RG_13040 [Clostridium perfringens]